MINRSWKTDLAIAAGSALLTWVVTYFACWTAQASREYAERAELAESFDWDESVPRDLVVDMLRRYSLLVVISDAPPAETQNLVLEIRKVVAGMDSGRPLDRNPLYLAACPIAKRMGVELTINGPWPSLAEKLDAASDRLHEALNKIPDRNERGELVDRPTRPVQ